MSAVELNEQLLEVHPDVPDVPLLASEYAKKLMHRLGYSMAELDYLGDREISLMSPVGNPHPRAACDIGEVVVDIGSGNGADCFLAGQAVGHTGKVIGIDLSSVEVKTATERVKEREMTWVEFQAGSTPENLPVEDGLADVVISNGGLDLAPSHPEALKEALRVLRPGGRFSMSCTVLEEKLDTSRSWPPCIKALLRKDRLEPLLRTTGFDKILVEEQTTGAEYSGTLWGSEDLPAFEARVRYLLPDSGARRKTGAQNSESFQEAQARLAEARATHRRGLEQLQHQVSESPLNEICKRVNVSAVKPQSSIVDPFENLNTKSSLPFQAGFMMLGFFLTGCLTFGPIFLRRKPKWKRGEYGKDIFKKRR